MKGIIGRKIGMTSIFDEDGINIPCTVIEAGPCIITQVKTEESDGYNAVQLGFDERKPKNTPKALINHFKKANTSPKMKVIEFRDFDFDKAPGDTIDATIFEENEIVNVVGISKGKGFQGVVKRHGFSGVGMATHGQHNRMRAPGSIGMSSTPSRVFKGMRMGGRMGNDRVKLPNVVIVKVMADKNLILVRGSVPGHNGAYVTIESQL